jgi:4-hydroxybenzoate polyprenyltransferase
LFRDKLNYNYLSIFMIIFTILLIYQILLFNKNKPKTCLIAFKTNNLVGLIMFIGILSIKFN